MVTLGQYVCSSRQKKNLSSFNTNQLMIKDTMILKLENWKSIESWEDFRVWCNYYVNILKWTILYALTTTKIRNNYRENRDFERWLRASRVCSFGVFGFKTINLSFDWVEIGKDILGFDVKIGKLKGFWMIQMIWICQLEKISKNYLGFNKLLGFEWVLWTL